MPDTTAIKTDNGHIGTGDNSSPQKAKVEKPSLVAQLVTRSKKRNCPEIVTRSNVLPESDDMRQSITLGGFLFKRDGVGWECRDVIYIEDPVTGKKRRKRPYLAHLSRTNYEEMRKEAPTPETLTESLITWAKNKQKGKQQISK